MQDQKVKHTPGPWVAQEYQPQQSRETRWNVWPTGDGVRSGIAEVYAEADARLIAAAPDLLEAAKLYLDANPNPTHGPSCPKFVHIGHASYDSVECDHSVCETAKLRAAIDKAEGRSD